MEYKRDFFERQGVVSIASRLRRLTETLIRDDAEIYRLAGLNFKPKWFPVFLTLADGGVHTVTSIAREIGQTHPSVSVIVREMGKAGLIEERKNSSDGRSTGLCLSETGRKQLPCFGELLRDVEAAALSVCQDSTIDLWGAIREWEKALGKKSLLERTRDIRNARLAERIRIFPWDDRFKEDFFRLSALWIKQYFVLEEADLKQLSDPYGTCIENGGEIFSAVDTAAGKVAGVCALVHHVRERRWELSKLCVDPAYRGLGIGERLVEAVIASAVEKKVKRLFLVSNRILAPAIGLYRKMGFVETPLKNSEYRRADIQMVKKLHVNTGK